MRAPTRNPFNIGEVLGIPGQARDDGYARDDGRWTIFLNLLTLVRKREKDMIELSKEKYTLVIPFLKDIECETIYAYSILENKQQGRIFVDNLMFPKTALFWHYCGFAIVSGDCNNNEFNNELLKLLYGDYEKNQRKFVLYASNDAWRIKLSSLLDDDQVVNKRLRLSFKFDDCFFNLQNFSVPYGYEIKEIDKLLLEKIEGNIIPRFSWHSPQAFLDYGKGFCLIHEDKIACTAFSASIGNNQIDIGVETNDNYRRNGFGVITAAMMVSFCLDNAFEPIWGCRNDNTGSSSIALKLGFRQRTSYAFYVKA